MKYKFLKYRAMQGKVTGRYYIGCVGVTVDAPEGEFEGESDTVIEIVKDAPSGKISSPRKRANKHAKRAK